MSQVVHSLLALYREGFTWIEHATDIFSLVTIENRAFAFARARTRYMHAQRGKRGTTKLRDVR